MTIYINISCETKCHLDINSIFRNKIYLSLGEHLNLAAPNNIALPIDVEIKIPTEINYTEISIIVKIKHF